MNTPICSMPSKSELLAGISRFTVVPNEDFIREQEKNGVKFHEVYSYRIDKVESNSRGREPIYFLSTRSCEDVNSKWVYVGVVNPRTGNLRLTAKSAFPQTATRVRVGERVLMALFANRGSAITANGWWVSGAVHKDTRAEEVSF